MKKVGHKSNRGGWRERAGRKKTGQTKQKVSVSVDRKILRNSLAKWQNRASKSGLVEMLLREYVSGEQKLALLHTAPF
jgi:hypothetical protein